MKTLQLKPMYSLTLTQEVFALALSKNSPFAGSVAVKTPNGKWRTGISLAMAEGLKEAATPGENWSDTVKRILTAKPEV